MTYGSDITEINQARASVLIKGIAPQGRYDHGGETHTQYKTPFGLVTVSTDSWGDFCGASLLRYA